MSIECLTSSDNSAGVTNACGPDYGVDCMPQCDPADDWG